MSGHPVVNRQHTPGTYSGYNWHMERRAEVGKDGKKVGKRHKVCRPCQLANTNQMDGYRKRVYLNGGKLNRPIAGTRRRLQALAALGYSAKDIARRYGRDHSVLSNLTNRKTQEWVYRETAEKIAPIYDELSMLPPEPGMYTKRTASQARARGYLPPLYWDDEAIDDPYALPTGLDHMTAYHWFWGPASDREKIEYVLEHGLSVTRMDALWKYHKK